ncbi:hypothetical protein GGE06_007542 [Streptomyces sp. SFB5A]|uniref:Uncharacterized protein n=1 Tax=Streptomyces nymphaeiformis TaxID=2663842 RepID=A0A7W7U7Y7_9ACTN|nr:hypothetical protein [Streptomyces nymphaeiformis]
MTIDHVEPLLPGESHGRRGDPAVRDDHGDVGLVDLTRGAVEDLEIWGSHSSPGKTFAPMLALNDPATAEGIGGLHIRSEVAASSDPHRVTAAVAVHQVTHRLLEPCVVKAVEVGQRVAQSLGPHRLPPGSVLPTVQPEGSRQGRKHSDDDENPRVSQ